jgi:hypothetical protein
VKGGAASGPPGRVSYFIDALIRCLNGLGAREVSGLQCPVHYDSLRQAMKEVVVRTADANPQLGLDCEIVAHNGLHPSVDFHFAAAPVQVLTLIRTRPAPAQQAALELWLEDMGGIRHDAPIPAPSIWRHEIPAGDCRVGLSFAAVHPWADYVCPKFQAFPPLFNPTITLKPRGP